MDIEKAGTVQAPFERQQAPLILEEAVEKDDRHLIVAQGGTSFAHKPADGAQQQGPENGAALIGDEAKSKKQRTGTETALHQGWIGVGRLIPGEEEGENGGADDSYYQPKENIH